MRTWIVGHTGLVGSAVVRRTEGDVLLVRRDLVDLFNRRDLDRAFGTWEIDSVIFCAGSVGGIQLNSTRQFDQCLDNAMMICNMMSALARNDVEEFIYLGSTCMYPRDIPRPSEWDIGKGIPERTNTGYAIAKQLGMVLTHFAAIPRRCTIIPTNLYGPCDNFHPMKSHAVAGIMRKLHQAKEEQADRVCLWGTGRALRDFLYVDDLAEAINAIRACEGPLPSRVNVGTGWGITIKQLAETISEVVGYNGRVEFGGGVGDGAPAKITNIERISKLGWKPKTKLGDGLETMYRWWRCQEEGQS